MKLRAVASDVQSLLQFAEESAGTLIELKHIGRF